ncbi:hypothetical protein VTI74DRAFT_8170 [Chaetomium olivicolor]
MFAARLFPSIVWNLPSFSGLNLKIHFLVSTDCLLHRSCFPRSQLSAPPAPPRHTASRCHLRRTNALFLFWAAWLPLWPSRKRHLASQETTALGFGRLESTVSQPNVLLVPRRRRTSSCRRNKRDTPLARNDRARPDDGGGTAVCLALAAASTGRIEELRQRRAVSGKEVLLPLDAITRAPDPLSVSRRNLMPLRFQLVAS